MLIQSIALILFCALVNVPRASGAATGPRPRVRPSARLIESLGCAADLTRIVGAVEQQLEDLNARRASVYLGTYAELDRILVKAGVPDARATAMVNAVSKVRQSVDEAPTLRLGGDLSREYLNSNLLLTCVASVNCELPGPDANHLLYTGVGKEAVVLLPAPKVHPIGFAINFWGTISAVAGEQFMLAWMKAGYALESERRGRADALWKAFVSPEYRGGFPRPGQDLDQGFAVTFLLVYQAYQSTYLYELHGLTQADQNRRHLAAQVIERLYAGPTGHLTGPSAQRLGLTPDNVFERFGDVLWAMVDTMPGVTTRPN